MRNNRNPVRHPGGAPFGWRVIRPIDRSPLSKPSGLLFRGYCPIGCFSAEYDRFHRPVVDYLYREWNVCAAALD